MSFVKPLDDFDVHPLILPNLSKMPNSIEDFVDAEEEIILRKLLGNTLYDAMTAGLAEDSIEEKWTLLRDGDTYTIGGNSYRWVGLRDMLKGYIYFRWLEDTNEDITGVGAVKGKAENANVVSAWPKMVRGWELFAKKAGAGLEKSNSLYGYVTTKGESVYADFEFCDPGYKNRFDF
jgi:hypothetical protein